MGSPGSTISGMGDCCPTLLSGPSATKFGLALTRSLSRNCCFGLLDARKLPWQSSLFGRFRIAARQRAFPAFGNRELVDTLYLAKPALNGNKPLSPSYSDSGASVCLSMFRFRRFAALIALALQEMRFCLRGSLRTIPRPPCDSRSGPRGAQGVRCTYADRRCVLVMPFLR